MALEAHKLYKQIADEEGIEFDKVEKGIHTFTLQMKNLTLQNKLIIYIGLQD